MANKVPVELPWGEVRQVQEYAVNAVLQEIARQAALPVAVRDYSALFALLDAESGTGNPQEGFGTPFPGGRNITGVIPATIPYGREIAVTESAPPTNVLAAGPDSWRSLFSKGR